MPTDTEVGSRLSEVVRNQLESLVKLSSPDLVVAASAAGHLPTLRDYLTKNPGQVFTYLSGVNLGGGLGVLLMHTTHGFAPPISKLICPLLDQ